MGVINETKYTAPKDGWYKINGEDVYMKVGDIYKKQSPEIEEKIQESKPPKGGCLVLMIIGLITWIIIYEICKNL